MPTIRVAIVEDSAAMRDGLSMILNGSPGFTCTCAAADAEAALDRIPLDPPDVVLMDINLPEMSGVECVRRLKERLPATQIIMLTIEVDSRRVFQSLEAGASGYLVKDLPPAEILESIQEAYRGGAPMSSQVARMVVQSFHRRSSSPAAEENLTPREEEILGLLAKGYRTKEVADKLAITPFTVSWHLRNIYDKFHVRSCAGAVARFLRRRGE
jgi:DNA-binding NarL/FixJ family response regulator